MNERFKLNKNERQETSLQKLEELRIKLEKADQHKREYFNKIGERQQYRREVNRLKETEKNDIQSRCKR